MSDGGWTSRVATLGMAFVSLALALALAELVLRCAVPMDTTAFSGKPLVPDPVLGWALAPNSSWTHTLPTDGTSVEVSTNSLGWRDVEHTREKESGVFRILVLGDSFMEAASVPLDEAFARLLERHARASGRAVEVLNAGVSGYGTLQEYLQLREIGLAMDPDLVLLAFYASNDVRNNSRELESRLDAGAMSRRPYLVPDEQARGRPAATHDAVEFAGWRVERAESAADPAGPDGRQPSWAWRWARRLLIVQLLYRAIASPSGEPVPASPDDDASPGTIGRNESAELLLGVHYCEEPAAYTRAWATTARILTQLERATRAAGADLVVVTVPGVWETQPATIRRVGASLDDPRAACLDDSPASRRLGGILSERDVAWIDLTPAFRRAARSGARLFRRSDRHWAPEGHALAARRVFSELVRRDLLPPPGTPSAASSAASAP